MSNYFTAPDGADEPTIWERADGDPVVVVRRAELPGPHADLLWQVLVDVLVPNEKAARREEHAAKSHLMIVIREGRGDNERDFARAWHKLAVAKRQLVQAGVKFTNALAQGGR